LRISAISLPKSTSVIPDDSLILGDDSIDIW
jgi:hypothetical protein